MASSSDMKQMYKSVDPTYPDCVGKQFNDDAASPEYLDVSYDEHNNERAEDRPFHKTGLAGDSGSMNYSGNQYATDFSSYGKSVDTPASVERISVDTSRADRGRDS